MSEQWLVIAEARDCINKLVRENEAIQENFMKREREAVSSLSLYLSGSLKL